MSTQLNVSSMSLQDIESIGTNIQSDISSSVTDMLKKVKLIDLGEAGNKLQELSEIANSAKGGGMLQKLPIVRSSKRWLARYETIESKITTLGTDIEKEQEKLGTVLDSLVESKDYLRSKLSELTECEEQLQTIVETIQANPDIDEDGLKLDATVRRLKVISTTNAVVKQEVAKTVLVIKENKEIQSQLNEACTNLIPMFNVMMMNTLASRANEEALKIKKSLVKTANKMVIENAKQIERTADELIAGRTESLIDIKTIEEANRILQNTVKKVIESSTVETEANLKLVESLKQSSITLKGISCSDTDI